MCDWIGNFKKMAHEVTLITKGGAATSKVLIIIILPVKFITQPWQRVIKNGKNLWSEKYFLEFACSWAVVKTDFWANCRCPQYFQELSLPLRVLGISTRRKWFSKFKALDILDILYDNPFNIDYRPKVPPEPDWGHQ